jgi:putative endonuclease
MMNNRKIGDFGEDLAVDFLQNKGYKILDRNYYIKGAELDVVALQGDEIVFVEVKTRLSNMYGYPEEGVTFFKQEKMARAIRNYMGSSIHDKYFRIDIVAIEIDRNTRRVMIKHIKNVIVNFQI